MRISFLKNLMIDHPYVIFTIIAIITATILLAGPELRYEASLASFFNEDDPTLKLLDRIISEFGSALPIVLAFSADDLFSASVLAKIEHLTERIRGVKHVARVFSLSTSINITATSEGIEIVPLFKDAAELSEKKLLEIKEIVLSDPMFRGTLVSNDGSTAIIYMELVYTKGEDDTNSFLAIEEIQKIIAEENVTALGENHLMGVSVIFDHMKRYIRHDILFLPLSTLVAILFGLYFTFRLFHAVLLPILVIVLTAVWTISIMALMGKPLTMASTLLPPLLLVIGMADSVHIINHYYYHYVRLKDFRQAISKCLQEVTMPCLLTSLTTMMGFCSLLVSDLLPIKEFGIFAALGIFLAFLLSISFIPAALGFFRTFPRTVIEEFRSGWFSQGLDLLGDVTHRYFRSILTLFGLFLIFSFMGIARLQVETHTKANFKDGSEVMRSINFVEKHFSGMDVIVLVFDTQHEDGVHDPEILRQMEVLEHFLLEA